MSQEFFVCPHCGADIEADAEFCGECGASHESGWNDEGAWSDPDEDDFDYDEFVAREFPERASHLVRLRGWSLVAMLLVVLLCLALVLGMIL